MSAQLIQSLIPHLPRFAEEDADFYSVPRDVLIDTLCLQHSTDRALAENTVALLETLLDTLAVLNKDSLQIGDWCFVSFPAQLLANSILTALSDQDSRLFSANFWNTQGIANDKKNQQREVLHIIEQARYEHHAGQQAQPIRYCYVAWCVIKLDGKILFYQREDTQKRFDKAAGDYGLLGGRANQQDIPIADKTALLNALQAPDSEAIKNALPETLKRELREEAGLLFETHYRFKPWRRLKPYRQVQGTAPNHALTDYYLDVFQIELTLQGTLFLLQKIKTDDRLAWFSLTEMVNGATIEGKIAYIKALLNDFGGDNLALEAELALLPDSFTGHYLFQPQKYGLTLPINNTKPLYAGVLGKEKALSLNLSDEQFAVLLGLAAHLRGFEFAVLEQTIILHPFGWLEIKNHSIIETALISLAKALKDTDLIIENQRDLFFRLSISPEVVYFDETLFSLGVKQEDLNGIHTKIPVLIQRTAFETALGLVKDHSETFKLTLEFAHKLKSLTAHQFSTENEDAVKIEDTYKKGLHKDPKFLVLGLRSLIRREAGCIKFVLPFISH